MNTYRNTLRKLQAAVRSTLAPSKSPRATLERMEERRLMAATSIKSVDSGGPDYAMVEADGVVYTLTSSASGAANSTNSKPSVPIGFSRPSGPFSATAVAMA